MLAWLTDELDRLEAVAQAVPGAGPWHVEACMDGCPCIVAQLDLEPGMSSSGMSYVADVETPEHGAFIAESGPSAALRRIAADREMLADLLAERHLVADDCWYTCLAATGERDGGASCQDPPEGSACDCGRDNRVERRIRLIAKGYGWTAPANEELTA